jgi:hypothetical protein
MNMRRCSQTTVIVRGNDGLEEERTILIGKMEWTLREEKPSQHRGWVSPVNTDEQENSRYTLHRDALWPPRCEAVQSDTTMREATEKETSLRGKKRKLHRKEK